MEPSDFILNYFYKILEWDIYKFLIPDNRLTPAEIERKLDECSEAYHERASRLIGYQLDTDIKHTQYIQKFLDIHLNNIGDPFQKGTFLLNTKEIEYAVVRYYAQLWNNRMRNMEIDADPHTTLKQPDDVYWGYVLSMGSSEGNIMATWMGRDYVGGKYLLVDMKQSKLVPKRGRIVSKKQKKPTEKPAEKTEIDNLLPTVFFSSTAAHYSVIKAAVLMNVPTFGEYGNEYYPDAVVPGIKETADAPWPDQVPVYNDLDGRVDVDKLVTAVNYFAAKNHGTIVVLNFGTTFTGAFDELDAAIDRLKAVYVKHGLDEVTREVKTPDGGTIIDVRTGFWIHVDAAYGGSYMPYLAKHYKGKPDEVVDVVRDPDGNTVTYKASQIPNLDMTRYPEIHSTVTSGHKFPGMPWPCGIYMSRHKYQLHPPSSPMYIGSMDSTLSGSRNGLSPIIYWKYLSMNSEEKIIDNCVRCLKYCKEVEEQFRVIINKKNSEKGLNLRLIRGPFGLTLIFSKMRRSIRNKYTLAEQTVANYDYNHLFIFTGVVNKPAVINEFLADAAEDYSFEIELENVEVEKMSSLHYARSEKEMKRHKKVKYRLGQGTC